MRGIIVAVLTASAGGCVMVRTDPAVKAHRPAAAELADFAGTYASASSHPPLQPGLPSPRTFGDVGPVYFRDIGPTFELLVPGDGRLIARAWTPDGDMIERNMLAKRDFTVSGGVLRFGKTRFSAGDDGPGFGFVSDKAEWSQDPDGNLVVVGRGGGVGFFTIVPFVAGSNEMAVFPRVADRGRDAPDTR